MPDREPPLQEPPAKEPKRRPPAATSRKESRANADSRSDIINSVRTVLGFLALVVLIAEATLIALAARGGLNANYALSLMLLLLLAMAVLVVVVAARWPGVFGLSPPSASNGSGNGSSAGNSRTSSGNSGSSSSKKVETSVIEQRLEKSPQIAGEEAPPPSANIWFDELRPVLHQAIHYTSPTYFLDTNLKLIDWNLAFELIFSRSLARIGGRHVKHFIVELANYDEVIAHAQEFTKKVIKGKIPFVDVEPLRYGSERYGDVSFVKVASQLHDPQGQPRGWSVSLMVRDIDWETFQRDLLEAARNDKLWSVYSASYDRVLLEFPPYRKLIDDVIAAVPAGRRLVADLGAGTGNVTAALLAAGHQVTAVESNMAMLDRLRSKKLTGKLTVVKSTVENLTGLTDEQFDAVLMVNVLYVVSDPLTCLQGVHRILKPGGMLAFSTTHSEVDLDTVLGSIQARLEETGKFQALAADYKAVFDLNKALEKEVARRFTRDNYREWTRAAGFEIIRDVPSTYEDAVMLIHARKV